MKNQQNEYASGLSGVMHIAGLVRFSLMFRVVARAISEKPNLLPEHYKVLEENASFSFSRTPGYDRGVFD